jgi:hypothetical protein
LVDDLDAKFFADQVLPLDGQGYRCISYQSNFKGRSGRLWWENVAFPSNAGFVQACETYPSSPVCAQVYFTPTTLKETNGRFLSGRVPKVNRLASNFHSSRALVIDVDAGKEGGYATTQEGKDAVLGVLHSIDLHPTVGVFSSAPMDCSRPVEGSGLHLYLIAKTCMTRELRDPMARNLVDILVHNGVFFDRSVTSNPVGLARPVGSINRKKDKPRQARLDLSLVDGPVYDVEQLAARLAAHRPPGRTPNNPPEPVSADLAEIESVVRFLIEAGFYGNGQYVNWSYLFFALGLAVHERPELYEPIRNFFIRMTVEAGRDVGMADYRLSEAIKRADAGIDNPITMRSVFDAALKLGWKPPPLAPEQETAIAVGRGRLHNIFDLARTRTAVLERAGHLVREIGDPAVRRRVGYVCAGLMQRDRYSDNQIMEALSLAEGRTVQTIPSWLGAA